MRIGGFDGIVGPAILVFWYGGFELVCWVFTSMVIWNWFLGCLF